MNFDSLVQQILENIDSNKELEQKFEDNPIINQFVDKLLQTCEEHNISLDLSHTEKVDSGDGLKCNGYFDSDKRILSVAIKNPLNLWLRILVHESCHLDQFLEDKEWYDEHDSNANTLNIWLGSESSADLENKNDVLASVVEMELDCEKRSIAKIQENELPIDLEEYIKEANEYLLSYAICIKTGKWDDCTEPLNAEVREAMPDQLLELKDYIDLDNPLLDIIMNPKHIDPKVFKDQIEDVKKNGPESEEESQTITNASNINDPNEDPITYKIVNGKKVLVGGFHRVRKALEGNLKEIPAKEVA